MADVVLFLAGILTLIGSIIAALIGAPSGSGFICAVVLLASAFVLLAIQKLVDELRKVREALAKKDA